MERFGDGDRFKTTDEKRSRKSPHGETRGGFIE
jgi:hypothetical protein